MVIVVILGGWLGWIVRCARIQRNAVAAVLEAKARTGYGGVFYDWQFKDGKFNGKGQPWWPAWLVKRIGVDYFQRVTWIYLAEVSEEELSRIIRLNNLEKLDLIGPSWDDNSLMKIKDMEGVRTLFIKKCPITDFGLGQMRLMKGLRKLYLLNTLATDVGLEELKKVLPLVKIVP